MALLLVLNNFYITRWVSFVKQWFEQYVNYSTGYHQMWEESTFTTLGTPMSLGMVLTKQGYKSLDLDQGMQVSTINSVTIVDWVTRNYYFCMKITFEIIFFSLFSLMLLKLSSELSTLTYTGIHVERYNLGFLFVSHSLNCCHPALLLFQNSLLLLISIVSHLMRMWTQRQLVNGR